MPKYQITAPDGQKFEIDAPEGASQADVMAYAQQNWKQKPPEPTTSDTAKSYGASALGGLLDPIDALAQLAPRAGSFVSSAGGMYPNDVSKWFDAETKGVDDIVKGRNAAIQDYRQKAGREGIDLARLAGNIVNPVNALPAAAVAGKVGQIGRPAALLALDGMKVGGLSAALQPVVNTDNFAGEKVSQAAMGAVLGGVLTPVTAKLGDAIARGVKQASRAVSGLVNRPSGNQIVLDAMQEAGVAVNEFTETQIKAMQAEVNKALRTGKVIDPAALFRKADFEQLGMTGTAGQITRDPNQFTRELNLSKTTGAGEQLNARFIEQSRRLNELLDRRATGAVDDVVAGQKVINRVKSVDDQMRDRVSGLYTAARESADAATTVPTTGLAQDLGNITKNYEGSIPAGLLNRFKDYGLLDGKQTKIFDMVEADQLLKAVNQYGDATNKSTQSALSELRNALKRSITESSGPGDPFETARKAASERFKLHEIIPALDKVSRGDAAPDDFLRKYVDQAKVSEVKGLAKVLDPDSIDQIKAQISDKLKRAAFGDDVVGDAPFAAKRYNTELRRIGDAKLGAFFAPYEIAQLKRIGRVASYKGSQPANSAVNNSNTASALYNQAKAVGAGLFDAPVLNFIPGAAKRLSDANAAAYALDSSVDPLIPVLSSTGQARLGLAASAVPLVGGLLAGSPSR